MLPQRFKNLFPTSYIKTRFMDLMSRQLIFAVIKRQQQAFRFSENDGNQIYSTSTPKYFNSSVLESALNVNQNNNITL